MYILNIAFHSSPKQYQYLLDLNSKIIPKTGDVLQRIDGCSHSHKDCTELQIMAVTKVDVLPSIVTSVIVINNPDLECTTHTLSSRTLKILRTAIHRKKATVVSTPSPPKKIAEEKISDTDLLNIIYDCILNDYPDK